MSAAEETGHDYGQQPQQPDQGMRGGWQSGGYAQGPGMGPAGAPGAGGSGGPGVGPGGPVGGPLYGAGPGPVYGPGGAGRGFGADDPRRKSPVLASVLSAVMPGLGQIYLGYYVRGFSHALVFICTITALASSRIHGLEPFFGVFLAFFYLYNIIDAGRRAMIHNQALAGMDPGAMPEDFKMPGGGSLAGGIALIVLGGLLLLNTHFDVSLEWLEDWWPAGLIIMGAWLAWKAMREKQRRTT
jgi:TM2 domain-containing membrane protein YozV